MARVRVDAGICGFSTEIIAESEDMNTVRLRFESACPLYSGFLKAIEVAAGLALPKDAHILIEK
jgi:hypothetical protein